jgi:Glycosyltransferases, probably involved in cell wall biogenesis
MRIDNGSTDDSRKIIKELNDKYKNKINEIILLDKNIGGEAINLGLAKAKGKLLHISENDIEYLPGWFKKVVKLFQTFNELGQLSLSCLFQLMKKFGCLIQLEECCIRKER